jgi:hypothetical protein
VLTVSCSVLDLCYSERPNVFVTQRDCVVLVTNRKYRTLRENLNSQLKWLVLCLCACLYSKYRTLRENLSH